MPTLWWFRPVNRAARVGEREEGAQSGSRPARRCSGHQVRTGLLKRAGRPEVVDVDHQDVGRAVFRIRRRRLPRVAPTRRPCSRRWSLQSVRTTGPPFDHRHARSLRIGSAVDRRTMAGDDGTFGRGRDSTEHRGRSPWPPPPRRAASISSIPWASSARKTPEQSPAPLVSTTSTSNPVTHRRSVLHLQHQQPLACGARPPPDDPCAGDIDSTRTTTSIAAA